MKAIANVGDAAQLLSIDALRLSLEIEKVSNSRLWRVLRGMERLHDGTVPTARTVPDAIAFSWQLIDTTHRIRRLAGQVRGLSHKAPAYQVFGRKTQSVDAFRNFFQHLPTEIPKLPSKTNPILGVLSWVTSVPTKSRTVVFGTFPNEGGFYSLALDTWTGEFVTRLQLTAGQMDIDLDAVHTEVCSFRRFFENWLSRSGFVGRGELRPSIISFYSALAPPTSAPDAPPAPFVPQAPTQNPPV